MVAQIGVPMCKGVCGSMVCMPQDEDLIALIAVSDALAIDESSDAYIEPKNIILPAAVRDKDAGKTVKIEHGRLFVDGEERDHVAWNGLEHSDCEGEIAHVVPKVMGQVVLEDGASFDNPILGFAQVCTHAECMCDSKLLCGAHAHNCANARAT